MSHVGHMASAGSRTQAPQATTGVPALCGYFRGEYPANTLVEITALTEPEDRICLR
jgi:hypothetical protein